MFKGRFSLFLHRLIVSIVAITVCFSSSIYAAVELPKGREAQWAENDILFYNPGDSLCESSSTSVANPSITWIGDSYSVGAESIIKGKFSDVSIDAEVGRNVPQGLSILEDLISSNSLRPYLVFALGGNGGWNSNSAETFKQLLDGTDTRAVLITSKMPGNDYAASNSILEELAQASNISLVDWSTVYKDEFFDSDPEKIHPTANGGYEAWVGLIAKALPSGGTGKYVGSNSGTLSGNSPEEKIWSYFATAGISGVSDDPAVIAGILGNLKQENSTFNPFLATSSGYIGIFMAGLGRATALRTAMADAGLSQYIGKGVDAVDEAIYDQALKLQLDFMLNSDPGLRIKDYINNLSVASNPSPESYAELFLIAFEGAYWDAVQNGPRTRNAILDDGVRNWGLQKYGYYQWQEAEQRRGFAVEYYNRFSGSTYFPSSGSGSRCSGDSYNPGHGDFGEGGEAIARAAVYLAWPWNEGESGPAGMCREVDGSHNYSYVYHDVDGIRPHRDGETIHVKTGNVTREHSPIQWANSRSCQDDPKPEWRTAVEELGYHPTTSYSNNQGGTHEEGEIGFATDCGFFVTTVIGYSGVDDGIRPDDGLGKVRQLASRAGWANVASEVRGDSSKLMPGDVITTVSDGQQSHTFIYVGNFSSYGNYAEASNNMAIRVGRVGSMTTKNGNWPYVYRYIGV